MRTAEFAGTAESERTSAKAGQTDGEVGMFTCFKSPKNLSGLSLSQESGDTLANGYVLSQSSRHYAEG